MDNIDEQRAISQSTTEESEKRRNWHRGFHMTLHPLFLRKGYESIPELDVSQKEQLIDIVTVRRIEGQNTVSEEDDLPAIYWEVFENFNQHNLISFKSHNESFNSYSLMELYGHLINYSRSYECELENINLYAVVNHYPRKLLDPFKDTKFTSVYPPQLRKITNCAYGFIVIFSLIDSLSGLQYQAIYDIYSDYSRYKAIQLE